MAQKPTPTLVPLIYDNIKQTLGLAWIGSERKQGVEVVASEERK